MKKWFVFFIFVLLSVSFINANLNVENYNAFCNMDTSEQEEIFEIPSYVPYQNEVLNINIVEEDLKGNIVIEEGKITSFACEETENSTYNVYIDNLATIEEIGSSGNFLDAYNAKISNGEIEVKGVGIGKKIKLTFTKIIMKIASWFS